MTRTPVITLLAGLAVGAVLLVVSSIAPTPKPPPLAAFNPSPTPAPTDIASPSPAPVPAPKVTAVWAGEVDGGGASIAISVKDGVAIAYLCDGKKTEAWLQGTAEGGKLALTGNSSSLVGTFSGGKAVGSVTVNGRKWTFTAAAAKPPGGLYRAAQFVDSAKVVCGWIVLPDGRQVGLCSGAQPAPALDPNTVPPVDPQDVS